MSTSILVNEGKYNLMKGVYGDLVAGTSIKLALIDNSVGPVTAATTYTNISGKIVPGSVVTLLSKSIASNTNVFTAAPPTITGVASGITVKGYIIYFDNGSLPATLIGYTDNGTGLPFTTNGGNITITFSGSGIFAL